MKRPNAYEYRLKREKFKLRVIRDAEKTKMRKQRKCIEDTNKEIETDYEIYGYIKVSAIEIPNEEAFVKYYEERGFDVKFVGEKELSRLSHYVRFCYDTHYVIK